MTQIISGQFDDFERADLLAAGLQTLGVDSDDIQKFVLNAPGQHERYPIGGGKHADRDEEPSIRRPAGVRVVVQVPTPEQKALVLDALLRHHARSVEEAEGTWRNGAWADFDPVSVPRWVVPPSA